jgi:hypothetical protein
MLAAVFAGALQRGGTGDQELVDRQTSRPPHLRTRADRRTCMQTDRQITARICAGMQALECLLRQLRCAALPIHPVLPPLLEAFAAAAPAGVCLSVWQPPAGDGPGPCFPPGSACTAGGPAAPHAPGGSGASVCPSNDGLQPVPYRCLAAAFSEARVAAAEADPAAPGAAFPALAALCLMDQAAACGAAAVGAFLLSIPP